MLDYHPDPAGGAERQARHQAEELARRGYRVTIVCRGMRRTGTGTVGGVRVVRLRAGGGPLLRLAHYPRLAWYLARHAARYDLIHVHHANLQADVAVAVGRIVGRPVYLKLAASGPSGEISRWRWLRRWTGHLGVRRASAIQAISPAIAAELRAVGVRPGRIVSIPNGLPPAALEPVADEARAAARRLLGLPADATVVLSLGRFAVEKGIADLFEAWLPLRTDPSLALLLVGRPAGRRPVLPTAGDNVHVVPWLDDPTSALRAADLFVLPSHGEGMSNALLEALAAGLPAIVTPVGIGPERVAAAGAGIVVPIGDPAALRAAIVALADDPDGRRAASLAAREAVADLTIDRVVDRIEAIYGQLVAARSPGRWRSLGAGHATMVSDTTSARTRHRRA